MKFFLVLVAKHLGRLGEKEEYLHSKQTPGTSDKR